MTTQDVPERQPNRRFLERRQADKVAREFEERYGAPFDSLDCVYLFDFDGRFLNANLAALELLGYEREEIPTLSFSSLLDDDQLAKASGVFAELKETGAQKTPTEFRLRRKTGEYVDVETKASVISREGQSYAVLGVAHDITERKKTEEALQLTQLSLDRAADLVHWVSPEGEILYVNDSACERHGYTREEMLAMRLWDLDPELSPDAWRAHWDDIKKQGYSLFEATHQTKSGEIFPVEVLSNYVRHDDKEYEFAFLRDIAERKEAELRLEDSEERMRLAFEASQTGLWDWDVKSDQLYVSPTYYTMLGYEPRSGPGDRGEWLERRVHPDDRAKVAREIQKVLTGDFVSYEYEARMLHADGVYRWVSVAGYGVTRDPEGSLVRLIGIRQDITERKRVEEELAKSERHFRSLIEHAADAIYVVTRGEVRIIACNEQASKDTGYSREELLGMKASDIEVSKTGSEVDAAHLSLLPEAARTSEGIHRRKDGSTFPVEIRSSLMEEGEPQLILSIVRDITERKQAEKELRLGESRLVEAQRLGKIGDWEWIPAEDKVIWSAEVYQIFGVAPESGSLTVETTMRAIHPEDRAAVEQATRDALEGRKSQPVEYRILKSDGTIAYVFGRDEAVLDAEGKLVKMTGIYQDITERKQAEQERHELERQLQQSQKLESLGVLAGGIAHDFNNILTSVLGNADLALAELPASAPARENLLAITQASHRAAALCRQMLAYSGRGQFVTEAIDLSALIEDMLDLLKSSISKKALLNLHLKKNLPLLEGDPSQLGQLIMNLVLNASEALEDNDGVITIATGARECSREYLRRSYAQQDLPAGSYLTLEVSDT
ncbi:MAG TPA: PAS domain S-box protein, partial [Thermoleophilia bacterium]